MRKTESRSVGRPKKEYTEAVGDAVITRFPVRLRAQVVERAHALGLHMRELYIAAVEDYLRKTAEKRG